MESKVCLAELRVRAVCSERASTETGARFALKCCVMKGSGGRKEKEN